MSNTTHTPEPWRFDRGDIIADTKGGTATRNVARVDTGFPENRANADRIVACVNACAGINPDAVPDLLAALIAVNGDVDLDRVAGGSTELAYMVANAIAKATGA